MIDGAELSYRRLFGNAGVYLLVAAVACFAFALPVRAGWLPFVPTLLGASVATVLLVVFGMRLRPLPLDGPPGWKLISSLFSRESLLPLGLPFGIMLSGFAEFELLTQAMLDRFPVIWFIMLFAALSYGLQLVGFFRYLATFTLLWSRGNLAKLTIGFFVLSSGLTYLSSNDVVAIVMTPLVLELARQSGIRDVRIMLLTAAFVATNTLSMGLPVGSPSNLIFALALGISFFDYVKLMMLPTLVTAVSSLLVVSFVYSLAVLQVGRVWSYDPGHLEMPPFTGMMAVWCLLFLAALVGYSVAMSAGFGFGWVSLPGTFVVLITLYFGSGNRLVGGVRPMGSSLVIRTLIRLRGSVQWDALSGLPWSIIGFAMSFFCVAAALVERLELDPLIESVLALPPVGELLVFMGLTALSVNSINDLPTAALAVGVLGSVPLEGMAGVLALQAVLVALNIGCYLTPVGALAGVVCFHIVRRDASRYGTLVPRPLDLLWYGGLHFMSCTVMLCAVLPGAHVVSSLATSGAGPAGMTGQECLFSVLLCGTSACLALVALVVCLRICLRGGNAAVVGYLDG